MPYLKSTELMSLENRFAQDKLDKGSSSLTDSYEAYLAEVLGEDIKLTDADRAELKSEVASLYEGLP